MLSYTIFPALERRAESKQRAENEVKEDNAVEIQTDNVEKKRPKRRTKKNSLAVKNERKSRITRRSRGRDARSRSRSLHRTPPQQLGESPPSSPAIPPASPPCSQYVPGRM